MVKDPKVRPEDVDNVVDPAVQGFSAGKAFSDMVDRDLARSSLAAADAVVDLCILRVADAETELRQARKAERDARAARARRAGLL